MELAVWLSLVIACVLVGMTYGRFAPGSCCGCGAAVCETSCAYCDSTDPRQKYVALAVDGVASGVNANCTLCENANGTYVAECIACGWSVAYRTGYRFATGVAPIVLCQRTFGFPPTPQTDYTLEAVEFLIGDDGASFFNPSPPAPPANHLPVIGNLVVWWETGLGGPELYGDVQYRSDVAETSPGSGQINCDVGLDGEVCTFQFAESKPDTLCDWSGATVTLSR